MIYPHRIRRLKNVIGCLSEIHIHKGAQVEYNQLFSSLIYKDFPDKVIVNAGISGAGLYDELNYFKDKGKKLSPKVVFLQIGAFNDFMNIREHQPSLQDYIMEWSALYRYFEYNIANSDELPLGRWTEPFFPNKEDNIDNNIFFKQTSDYKEADKRGFQGKYLRIQKKKLNLSVVSWYLSLSLQKNRFRQNC